MARDRTTDEPMTSMIEDQLCIAVGLRRDVDLRQVVVTVRSEEDIELEARALEHIVRYRRRTR